MNFASYEFWSTLAVCYIASRLVLVLIRSLAIARERLAGKLCLFATTLVLLAVESPLTLAAFLWVVGFGWLSVKVAAARMKLGKLTFVTLLIIQLAPLVYYKYWNFAFNEVLGLDWAVPSVVIPMGLSFYTFQVISFWVDSLRARDIPPKSLDFLNYCGFFPQIVAGPIERRNHLLPQIETFRFKLDPKALDSALPWIVLGLAYKMVIADNIGNLSGLLRVDIHNAWHIWFECFMFGLRIYFDFAGYSFIAVGLGLLFGVRLTLNFLSPYWAADLRDFWRRWHVTLGTWLRDYIYLPLGGRKQRWIFNTLVVFVVSGIWHGAGWGFLIWGALHGIGIVVCGLGRAWRLPSIVKVAITFTYVTATWLFFFERDGATLQAKAVSLINPLAYSLSPANNFTGIFANVSDAITIGLIATLAGAALIGERIGTQSITDEPYRFLRKRPISLILTAF
jgi:alginate O-acetyltransferase complex protein AlgI